MHSKEKKKKVFTKNPKPKIKKKKTLKINHLASVKGFAILCFLAICSNSNNIFYLRKYYQNFNLKFKY